MKIITIEGKPHLITEIEESDVFELQNGNLMVILNINTNGTYQNIIIDPEYKTRTYGIGDFTNDKQNENIFRKLEAE